MPGCAQVIHKDVTGRKGDSRGGGLPPPGQHGILTADGDRQKATTAAQERRPRLAARGIDLGVAKGRGLRLRLRPFGVVYDLHLQIAIIGDPRRWT